MIASISGAKGGGALSRRRGMTLPFCSFTFWVTRSSISSPVIVPGGLVIVVPLTIVAALTGTGLDVTSGAALEDLGA